uniref:Receptor-like serine/threonine-protein kinase n=1 Tax=Cannabis sativa TaxID=3483 RepID=A0A803NYW6_CANSA
MNFSETLCISSFLFLLPFSSCLSLNTITSNQPLNDGDLLISTPDKFALGFFSPANSRNRYVGIWYHKIHEQTIVWVANRDSPLNDTSGVLAIDSHGGLVIYGNKSRGSPHWSANVSVPAENNCMAKLLDVGNLVLFRNNSAQTLLWQSFDHPTNTMLPFMKLGLNRVTGLDRFLTSWKSAEDPGTGNNSFGFDPTGYPQWFLNQGGAPRWRLGSWTGRGWSGVPQMTPNFIFNFSFVNNQDELSITYGIRNESILSRMVLDESGTVYRSTWQEQNGRWLKFWSAPTETCDTYKLCGPNGICDPTNTDRFECTCLPGFDPKSPQDWYLRDGSGGCVKKQVLGRTCGNGEGFLKLEHVKVPDTSKTFVNMSRSLVSCEKECLKNCNCTAYASADLIGGIGCITWHGDLVDARTYPNAGQDFYLRVDSITLAQYSKSKSKNSSSISNIGKVGIALGSVALLFLIFLVVYWWPKKKEKEEQSKYLFDQSPSHISGKNDLVDATNSELPLFDIKTIAAATDNFSIDNKLGEGGFGSVYKGVFDGGKQIAVKRLSKHSGQGSEEFKNEVLLIAKLQHRNLVRILGCCVQGDEKMLIYEYLPNKSLDFFIFDEEKKTLLDWKKRFHIICGIARGMLYLHQDSRLSIIHRDLKSGNVLLDADLNPKIADFGMARIFGGGEIETNTNRVVGTYGYMSPEYAMHGRFSIKSDVYSFGVLMLEIITGKKNTSYYHENPESNLIGHVWDLWKEGRALEIIDSTIDESFGGLALRCITIGLLCVQEYAVDRPTMSEVIFMLGNETTLADPKQPAFVFKKGYANSNGDPSTTGGIISVNDITCTVIEAR